MNIKHLHCDFYSDTMGNMGAFITITGNNLKPNYRSFEAVVSLTTMFFISYLLILYSYSMQPHPDVKPMAYANSLMNWLA